MQIVIDDSGSFSWRNPGVSLFAGLLLPDRASTSVTDRFTRWKRTIIGKSKRELKGEELSDKQLYSFSYQVFPLIDHDPHLTVVGADTNLMDERLIRRCRDQVASQFAHCAKAVLEHNPTNRRLARQYNEGAGWVRKRSPENFLWVNTLEEQILQSVQHIVAYFLEPEDDPEFQNIEIIIDRSFIRREPHVRFWKEWLRNGLLNRSHREHGFALPDTWRDRNHPFVRKYDRGGLLEFNDLYQKHMRFDDSAAIVALQIVDICAHICYRYYRGDKSLRAYWQLRPRIVGEGGRPATVICFTEESLFKDAVENHVKMLDIEKMKAAAAERKRKRMGAVG